jgi:hypothetical protein
MVGELVAQLCIFLLPVFLLALVLVHLAEDGIFLISLQAGPCQYIWPARTCIRKGKHTSTWASFSALMRGAPFSSLMRFDRESDSSASGASERLRSSI